MLREAPVKTGTTFAEYLEFEQTSNVRHEFVDGNLFVMAGGTYRHNFIMNRVVIQLFEIAISKGFFAGSTDVIVKTPSGKGYYPDFFVTRDMSAISNRIVLHPNIIFEVLSNSTEAFDRGEKWEQYQKISSLEQYILLSQNEPIAEVFSRQGEKWLYEHLIDDATLKFSSLECEFVLSALYKNLPAIEQDS